MVDWQVIEVVEDQYGVDSISFVNQLNGEKVRFPLTADYDRSVIYDEPVRLSK